MSFLLLTAFNLATVSSSLAAVSLLGKICGTKRCQFYEYCSNFHNQCEGCSVTCDEFSHNFDQDICTKECQDYLHEIRFVKTANYSADTKILQNQQTIMLIIMIIILILFILVHGTHFIRWIRRRDFFPINCLKKFTKEKSMKSTIDLTHENPHTQSPKMRPRTDTNGRASTIYSASAVGAGSTIKTVSTPLSKRHPAEDSLDYSYDNGGLVVTPIHEKRGTETTF